MKLNKLIAGAAAIAMLGSLVTAVPAMAEAVPTTHDIKMPLTNGYKLSYQRSTNAGNDFSNTNVSVERNYRGTFDLKVKANDGNNLYKVTKSEQDLGDITDNNTETYIKNANTTSVYIPFESPTEISKVVISSNNSPLIIALVDTFNEDCFDVVNNEAESKTLISAPMYWRVDSRDSYSIINENYSLEITGEENGEKISTLTLNNGATAQNYLGILLENNNSTDTLIYDIEVYTIENEDSDGYEAELNGYYYDTLDNAIAAAESGDTIELLKDAKMSKNLYMKDGYSLTIKNDSQSETHTITTTGGAYTAFEVNSGCTLTLDNVNVSAQNSTVAIDAKSGTVNLNKSVVSNLNSGGYSVRAAYGGKLNITDCTVSNGLFLVIADDTKSSAAVNINTSSINNVIFDKAQNTNVDTGVLNIDDSSMITGALLFNTPLTDSDIGVQVVSGNVSKLRDIFTDDTYTIDNDGKIAKKSVEIPISATYKNIGNWDDETDPASAWELTVNPGTYTIDSFTLTIKDSNNNTHKATESPENTNVSGGAVVFGVAVNKAESFVQGMTLNVTSGSASSSIDATAE